MPKKLILDQFHYHEALDRCSVLSVIVHEHLLSHPVIQQNKEFKEKAEKACELLGELYQLIGSKSSE